MSEMNPLAHLMAAQFAARNVTPTKQEVTKPVAAPAPVIKPAIQVPSAGIDYGALMRAATKAVEATPVPKLEDFVPAPAPMPQYTEEEYESLERAYADSPDFYSDEESDESYADEIGKAVSDASLRRQAEEILGEFRYELDPSQKAAVAGMATSQYACLIGAAGTGKTSTVKFLLKTLITGDAELGIEPLRLARLDLNKYRITGEDHDSSVAEHVEVDPEDEKKTVVPAIAFVAFTGQAVQVIKKNMAPSWRKNCMTIHSLLGYAPEEYVKENGESGWRFAPTYGKLVKFPWNVIVVDESSMVNVQLWHEVLDACKPGTRIYFIGDLNQLPPPIGQGVLGFALVKWPVFELNVVHRQKDEAANRIVDSAWSILRGQQPVYDDPTTNPNWRVINFKIDHDAQKAHRQIVAIAKGLSQQKVSASVDPEQPPIYDPWRDRILVQMNGYNEESTGGLLGQFPLNESLSAIFADKTQPRIIIDAQRATKRFSVGYRVMATKNEPPNEIDRVTNGLTGKIVGIEPNPAWSGDWRLVGEETEVQRNRDDMVAEQLRINRGENAVQHDLQPDFALTEINYDAIAVNNSTPEERQSGPASHIVSVEFDNGAHRDYDLNAEVEQLQIAYASTTHKAQGAEMPTVIIVVHHASKRMLCRENLYTAITRASQRVVILDTDFGMRLALTTQKIFGKTLQEKIKQYAKLMGEGDNSMALMHVRLSTED